VITLSGFHCNNKLINFLEKREIDDANIFSAQAVKAYTILNVKKLRSDKKNHGNTNLKFVLNQIIFEKFNSVLHWGNSDQVFRA
jgi:hypothetical protein